MNDPEKKILKCQEWIVRFDGKIKQSEKQIDSDDYHKNLSSLVESKL